MLAQDTFDASKSFATLNGLNGPWPTLPNKKLDAKLLWTRMLAVSQRREFCVSLHFDRSLIGPKFRVARF